MRISFLKAAIKRIPPLAQRPLDSKILPQHRREGWPFLELISFGHSPSHETIGMIINIILVDE